MTVLIPVAENCHAPEYFQDKQKTNHNTVIEVTFSAEFSDVA